MVQVRWYPRVVGALLDGSINYASESGIKIALMDHPMAFDESHDTWSDISANDYSSATGYTAGGQAVGNKSLNYVASESLTARADDTAYVLGDIVRTGTDSDRCFQCVSAGTSDSSEPAGMATSDFMERITDGSVVWAQVGRGVTFLRGDAVSWSSLDGSETSSAAMYNDDGGDEDLLAHIAFEATDTPSEITLTPPTTEGWLYIVGGGGAL